METIWEKVTLTNSSPSKNVSFKAGGSIFCEGTFDSASVGLHVLYRDPTTGVRTPSTNAIDSPMDGSTINSIKCPPGDYQLLASGGGGSESIDVYYRDTITAQE
jgi:hypothetical protein